MLVLEDTPALVPSMNLGDFLLSTEVNYPAPVADVPIAAVTAAASVEANDAVFFVFADLDVVSFLGDAKEGTGEI